MASLFNPKLHIAMSSLSHLEARASHIYSSSREQVFDAWLNPAAIGNWMFGPAVREEEVVSIDIDPCEGGEFSFLVNRGNQVIDHIGTYAKIDRPSRLEFDWGVKGMSDSSRVAITIEPHDRGCKLDLVHYLDPAWGEYLDRSVAGWGNMLAVLEKHLSAGIQDNAT